MRWRCGVGIGELEGFNDDGWDGGDTLATFATVGKKKLLFLFFFSSSDIFSLFTFLPWLNRQSGWCPFLYEGPFSHRIHLNEDWVEDDGLLVVGRFESIDDGDFTFDGVGGKLFFSKWSLFGVFFIIRWDGFCTDDNVGFFFSKIGVFSCFDEKACVLKTSFVSF